MIPIDFQELKPEEITAIQRWCADPGYRLARAVVEARAAKLAMEAMKSAREGLKDALDEEVEEAFVATKCLELLEGLAQGYVGDNEETGRTFEYQRMVAAIK